jgi:dihydrolipoamide dehydrogenase
MAESISADLVVLGSGPGGYTAAFRAADLGLSVTIVERRENLGGVCLNVGCIPSKTLLHAAAVIDEVGKIADKGVKYGTPEIDTNVMRQNKNNVVKKLTDGLAGLCEARKIRVVTGKGSFLSANKLAVEGNSEVSEISFKNIIVASGSRPVRLPLFPENDPGIWSSTDALELKEIPERLLVVGGGIIGLEMATVYSALGSSVTVVEMLEQLIPPADADLVRPLYRKLKKITERNSS